MKHHYNIMIRFFTNPKDWNFRFSNGNKSRAGWGMKLFFVAIFLEHWKEVDLYGTIDLERFNKVKEEQRKRKQDNDELFR